MDIKSMIDHTILKPDAKKDEIQALCQEAKEFGFYAVCVNPYYVSLCKDLLEGSKVKIATVIGFPLGANTSDIKALETKKAIDDGADEIDMVINIGALKDGDYGVVRDDIKAVVEAAKDRARVKVIIETSLLTDDEKIKACELSLEAGADFVKTSTGFSTGGATVEDVKLMKSVVKDKMEIKASGGVRDFETARKMIEAGARRIGTSSG
ncbi:MAG: deoxyribose-phosphate aldolase, partial [Tissierellaceae bacterium]